MRHPATKGRADSNQKPIADAIRLLGFPVMDLHSAGNGVEDLLVGLWKTVFGKHPYVAFTRERWWLLVECKVARNRRGEVTSSQLTRAQVEWRGLTEYWPRITVTSAQDAVDQIRALTG